MPVHDWTRVEAGIFHAFHVSWLGQLQETFNGGLLPGDFYALAEQHAGQYIGDLLTLHVSGGAQEPAPPHLNKGGIGLLESPPRVQRQLTVSLPSGKRRTLAIRHVSGHRLVALVEIVSPANKDRKQHVLDFAEKAVSALELGVHLLIVDLFPPGPHDPQGMIGAIWELLNESEQVYELPQDQLLTPAAYVAGPEVDIHLEHVTPGAKLPQMPLFLQSERYVQVPLEATYQAAFHGMPAFWREVLEGPNA